MSAPSPSSASPSLAAASNASDTTMSDSDVTTLTHTMPKSCQYCQCAPISMQRCSSCQLVYYCSRICQKEDWKVHKSICVSKSANCRLIPTRMDALSILKSKLDGNCWAHAFSFLTAPQLGQVSRVNHCFRSASLKPAAASHEFRVMAKHGSLIGRSKRSHLPINLQYGYRLRNQQEQMIMPPEVIPTFPRLERMRFDLIFDGDNTAPTKLNADILFAARLNQWLPQVASTLKYLELPLRLPEATLDGIAPNLSTCSQLETLILTRFTVQSEILRIVPELPKLKVLSVATLVVTPDFFDKHNAVGNAAALVECQAVLPKFFHQLSMSTTLRALEVDHSHSIHNMAYQLVYNSVVFPHLEWLSTIVQEYQGPKFGPVKADELVHLKHIGTNFPRLKSLSLTVRMNESMTQSPPRTPAREAEEIAFRDALLDNLHEGLKPLSHQLHSFFMILASEQSDGRSAAHKKQLDAMIAKREFNKLSFTHRPIDQKEVDKLVSVLPGLYSFQLQTMKAGRSPSLFTKEAIQSIVKHCPKLRYLELMYDPLHMDDLLHLSQLKSLKRLYVTPLPDENTIQLPPEPTDQQLVPPVTHTNGNDPCKLRLLTDINQTHLPILRHLPPVQRLQCDNRELHYEVFFAYAECFPILLKLHCFQDFNLADFKSYRDTMQTHPSYLNKGVSYRLEHEVQSITQEQYDLLKAIPNIREGKLSDSPLKAMYEYAIQSIARDRAALKESSIAADGSASSSASENARLWWMPESLHMMAMNIGSNRFGAYDPLVLQRWIAVYKGHYLEYNVPLNSKSHPEKPVMDELVNKKLTDFIDAELNQLSCSRLVIQPLLHGKNWIDELELLEL